MFDKKAMTMTALTLVPMLLKTFLHFATSYYAFLHLITFYRPSLIEK